MRYSTNRSSSKRNRLELEKLEERWTPAQFGIPWADPTRLTLSFVPDGTQIQTESSQLQSSLDAQMPRNTWRDAVIKAFQAWSEVANVNVGLVTDSGHPLGTVGATQGDARFGDIRIAGLPLSDDTVAVSIPPSHAATGTFAGDLVINTRQSFDPEKLFAAALHEAGHILGLDHSADSASVMYPTLVGNTALTASDAENLRGLYGSPAADSNELSKSNDNLGKATRIKYSATSSGYNGSTPVIEYGDITGPTDIDYFYIPNMVGYSGPITFRIQTTGISMLTPKATIVDASGRILDSKVGGGLFGSVVTMTLPNSIPGAKYYLRLEASPTANISTGRYGVGVTFDQLLRPTAISLNNVLKGPYENLSPERVDMLFKSANAFLEDDLHTDDDLNAAVTLRTNEVNTSTKEFQAIGSLSDASDVDSYRIRMPNAEPGVTAWVLTVSVRGEGANPIVPALEVFDSALAPVPVQVIVNGNGEYAIEAVGVTPRRAYYVRAFSPSGATGNYDLHVSVGKVASELNEFVAGELSLTGFAAESTLYVGRSQLFNFLLTSTAGTEPIEMIITNLVGNIVHQQLVEPNKSSSGISTMLVPGQYRVLFRSNAVGSFRLRGSRITDPVGAVYNSTTFTPQYTTSPLTTPTIYTFPYLPTTPTTNPYAFTPPTMVG